jgi:hypothetical protein
MGVRIIRGEDYAAIYCSTSMTAFGPVFADGDEADEFLQWLEEKTHTDARLFDDSELHCKYCDYLVEREEWRKEKEAATIEED